MMDCFSLELIILVMLLVLLVIIQGILVIINFIYSLFVKIVSNYIAVFVL